MDRIDRIRAFVTVVDAGSFTAAAKRLRISNKLVSKYVAALEADLRLTLLHRTTRALSLTEAGERFLPAARRMLQAFDELETGLHADRHELTGLLRVSAPSTFGELFISELTRDFIMDHPRIRIDLALSDRYVDLAGEGIDIAIRIGNLRDSSLRALRLGRTEAWVVASPAFLDEFGTPKIPQDLKTFRMIRDTNDSFLNRVPFDTHDGLMTVATDSRIAVNSAAAVRVLALQGEGIAATPRFVVDTDVAEGRLVRVLSGYRTATLDIHAIQLQQSYALPRVRHYIDHLARVFKQRLDQGPRRDS